MQKRFSARRAAASLLLALLAAGAVWLLCRWVGYDLQQRLGNEPKFEIVNDEYDQIIDVPAAGLEQHLPLKAGQTIYGVRLNFSTHGELYKAGMVMVDLYNGEGRLIGQTAGNYLNVFDNNFTAFATGSAYRAMQDETLTLHIYNAVEWDGPLGLWASTGTVEDMPLTADGEDLNATLAVQLMTDDSGSWPTRLAQQLALPLAAAAFAAVLLIGLEFTGRRRDGTRVGDETKAEVSG